MRNRAYAKRILRRLSLGGCSGTNQGRWRSAPGSVIMLSAGTSHSGLHSVLSQILTMPFNLASPRLTQPTSPRIGHVDSRARVVPCRFHPVLTEEAEVAEASDSNGAGSVSVAMSA